jgi:chromosome partitioning protein
MIIATVNLKGGSGKSTFTQNLSACAHMRGRKTLVRDADTQVTSWQWWALRAAGSPLAGLRVERADDVRLWHLGKVQESTEGFELVFVDTPAQLNKLTHAVILAADVVVIPIKPQCADVWAAEQTKSLLDEADEQRGSMGRAPVRRFLAFNEVRRGTKDRAEYTRELEPLGMPVLAEYVGQSVQFDRARKVGESVVSVGHRDAADAKQEIEALFDAITGEA